MGWDMLITTRASAAAAVVVAVLASGCDTGFCADGEYPGTVVLTADGWRIDGTQGGLFTTGTPAETFAYADGSPFERCRVIGSISVRERGAQVDSDDYPLLEELGFFYTEPDDEGRTDKIVDELAGFDGITVFGGMAGESTLASVGSITGFNNVERLDGSLMATALVSGFRSLKEVAGTVRVRGLEGLAQIKTVGATLHVGSLIDTLELPQLEDVGGDVIIDGTRIAKLGFPALQRVGGSLEILGNGRIEFWGGLAHGATIQGDLRAENNAPVRDDVFENWLVASETTVSGNTRICGNRPRDEEGEPCR